MSSASKATVAGILDLAAGISALVGSFVLAALGLVTSGVIASVAEPEARGIAAIPLVLFLPLALLTLVAAVVAMVGGIAAISRRSWGWSVAGAVAALVCFLPVGVAAIVLTILAEEELSP